MMMWGQVVFLLLSVLLVVMVMFSSSAVAAKPSRSSDPNEAISQESISHYDPNMLPPLPLGQPDSIEYDIPGPPLNPDDFKQNNDIISHDPVGGSSDFDPIMIAGLFQGDILLNSEEELAYLTMGVGKNAIIEGEKRWPNGVIPYVISGSYDNKERGYIALAMRNFHDNTCIRFVPRSHEKDYIHILKGDGCSSSVGRIGGAQAVSLGPGCIYEGIAMHELMHACGFWHEQSRFDRDSFVYVDYSNIQDGMEYNFQKYDWNTIQNLSVKYDLESIMHYGPHAFAKNRERRTITPLQPGVIIGQRNGFSRKDKQKLELLYQCSNSTHTGFTTQPTVTPPKPVGCIDAHNYCVDWSKTGECERNPVWMKANCKEACGQCGCKNYHQFCEEWTKLGECTRNPAYMSQYCMQSCGLCDDTGVSGGGNKGKGKKCRDKNKHCEVWASEGQCRVNPEYMLDKCQKSCYQC